MTKLEIRRKEWEPQCKNMGVYGTKSEHLVGKGSKWIDQEIHEEILGAY